MARRDHPASAQLHHHRSQLAKCKAHCPAVPLVLLVPQSRPQVLAAEVADESPRWHLPLAPVEEAAAEVSKSPSVSVLLPRSLMMFYVPKMK